MVNSWNQNSQTNATIEVLCASVYREKDEDDAKPQLPRQQQTHWKEEEKTSVKTLALVYCYVTMLCFSVKITLMNCFRHIGLYIVYSDQPLRSFFYSPKRFKVFYHSIIIFLSNFFIFSPGPSFLPSFFYQQPPTATL